MNRRDFLKATVVLGFAAMSGCMTSANSKVPTKPNILFIAVDDLRPELRCYDNKHIKSPNMDKLAQQGLLFRRAYCQTAVCMPSRVSVLSGYRPESFGFSGRFSSNRLPKGTVSLPQLFKGEGYTTVSIGKIYHHNNDDPKGWTIRHTDTFTEENMCNGYSSGYQLDSNLKVLKNYFKRISDANLPRPNSCEISDTPDKVHPDGMIADRAIEELKQFKNNGKPFFLATGFYRPHLPFTPPKKYWDLYDRNNINLPPNSQPVINGITRNNWNELRRYGDIPKKGPVSEEKAKELLHGYYASVSFTDTQIGKVLAELKRLNLDKDTVIVLWGDHGWNLGEHGWWCKHINVETSTRTAMMISVPWMQKGKETQALVELVDIYPTLCEIAAIQPPPHLEGTSLIPLIENPERPWKKAVFSEIGGARTIRTDRYRLIKHRNNRFELFDHKNDPGEDVNVAEEPEYSAILGTLKIQLKEGWRAARPDLSKTTE